MNPELVLVVGDMFVPQVQINSHPKQAPARPIPRQYR